MEKKTSVVILFGGVSGEHEVSCMSAASVINHTDREKNAISAIGITKGGNWFLTEANPIDISGGRWENNPKNKRVFLLPNEEKGGLYAHDGQNGLKRIAADVVFPVLHGRNGEDGTMQGLLKILGIPFVGADTASSSLAMDKAATKAVIEQTGGIYQAAYYVLQWDVYRKDPTNETEAVLEYFENMLPLFVKPSNSGSSLGISKVNSREDLQRAMETAFKYDDKILIEEAIAGREIEVAVLGNSNPRTSCIGEIFSANEFYDYNSKYENENSHTDIVKDLDLEKSLEIQDIAIKVYQTLGCRGMARVDMFLKESGKIIFNEINTIPGFTRISMYPKLWEESGISYPHLIDALIKLALEQSRN